MSAPGLAVAGQRAKIIAAAATTGLSALLAIAAWPSGAPAARADLARDDRLLYVGARVAGVPGRIERHGQVLIVETMPPHLDVDPALEPRRARRARLRRAFERAGERGLGFVAVDRSAFDPGGLRLAQRFGGEPCLAIARTGPDATGSTGPWHLVDCATTPESDPALALWRAWADHPYFDPSRPEPPRPSEVRARLIVLRRSGDLR